MGIRSCAHHFKEGMMVHTIILAGNLLCIFIIMHMHHVFLCLCMKGDRVPLVFCVFTYLSLSIMSVCARSSQCQRQWRESVRR